MSCVFYHNLQQKQAGKGLEAEEPHFPTDSGAGAHQGDTGAWTGVLGCPADGREGTKRPE